jgi:transcriptional regulator with XRE-family HTH domain
MATRPFSDLESRMSPDARKRVAERVRQVNAEMLLSELRKQAEMSQAELAEALGIQQPNVSKLESEDDMQISTLRRLVKALGGRLKISVEIPGKGEYVLSQFEELQ